MRRRSGAIHNFVRPRSLGIAGPELGFTLRRDPDTVRIPDISFISRDRLPQRPWPKGYPDLYPDLAVEIVSPDNRPAQVRGKVRDYLRAGTRIVWVIYPETQTVVQHRPNGPEHTYTVNDPLDGRDVLPGFSLPVASLLEG